MPGAITTIRAADGGIEVVKGPKKSKHSHPPNREESATGKLTSQIKRKAEDHPEQPPTQLLRAELQGIPGGVLSQLPEQPATVRTITRARRKNLPPNPRTLEDTDEIPAVYRLTLVGEQFLLYDSKVDGAGRPDADDDDDDDSEEEGEALAQQPRRLFVFGTRKNIELLCESPVWFIDGTFKTSPSIFALIVTVIGLLRRAGSTEYTVAVPWST